MKHSINIRTGFQPVTHNIKFDAAKMRKGKDLAKLHIRRVEELISIGACKLIRCSCVRSYKVNKKPYAVSLELDDKRVVSRTSCTCVSGQAGKCKHIYGLIHRINTDRSTTKTSFEQEWDKPSDAQMGKDIYAKPLILAEKYKPNNNFCDVEPYQLTLEDLKDIDCPLRNVLKIENLQKAELVARAEAKVQLKIANEQQERTEIRECAMTLLEASPRDEELYWCDRPELDPSLQQFYETHVNVTHHAAFQICTSTVTQSQSSLWFDVRNVRISASSKAHRVKTRIKKTSNDLAKDFLISDKKTKSTPSQEYGTKNEKKAVKEYADHYNKVVRHVGVWVMPLQPWICGSPDGIILEDNKLSKILEIKCPSTCRYKPIVDKDTGKFNVGYLFSDNGTTRLKKSHQYYTQCQMLMYITGMNKCDLYVWSPKGSELVEVPKDDEFLKIVIPKIEEFYFNYFLPVLFDNNKENENASTAN